MVVHCVIINTVVINSGKTSTMAKAQRQNNSKIINNYIHIHVTIAILKQQQ